MSQDPRLELTRPDNAAQITDDLARIDYGTSFRPASDDARLRCGNCEAASPVDEFDDVWATRLEGQSDPDDMVLVVAARCPACGAGGSVVLGFGPEASAEDSAVVARVPDDAMHHLDVST